LQMQDWFLHCAIQNRIEPLGATNLIKSLNES
jgi:hypothetical protein